MLVVLAGIPGSGKTTVVESAIKKIGKEKKMEVVNYGTVMFDIAKSKKLVEDRDQMRKLDPQTQMGVQKAAAKKIRGMGEKKDVIVDTHIIVKTPKGYLPGLPKWVLEELKPDQIIIVEATPEEIATRRYGDSTRDRDRENENEIASHQEINRSMAAAYSFYSGATVKIIQNSQGKLEKAVEDMTTALK